MTRSRFVVTGKRFSRCSKRKASPRTTISRLPAKGRGPKGKGTPPEPWSIKAGLYCCRYREVRSVMLVDSHCHLDFPDLHQRLPDVFAAAKAHGIGRMVTISTYVSRFETYRELAEAHDNVFFTIGTH